MLIRMRTRLCLLATLFLALLWAQQPAPEGTQTYEQFRRWISMQPVDVQRGPDVHAKYREHLRTTGLNDAAIDAQLDLIRKHGQRLEVERWNRILTAEKPTFNTAPNAFLVEMAKGRKPGKALDVGMGQGRNAIWLAQQGWETTGFDPAERAVAAADAMAQKLGITLYTQVAGAEQFDFGRNRWDLILLSYVGGREFKDRIMQALRPGGIVVVEAFHRDATKGRSIGGGVVFDTAELPLLFKDLRVVRYQEPLSIADFGQTRVRVVQFCAEKPAE